VCLFCIAIFAVLIGAVTTAVLDELESRLSTVAVPGSVSRLTDSGSTATIACSVPVPAIPGQAPPRIATAPVLITVYKAQKRLRIQVQTHDVTEAESRALQDRIAGTCGLTILSRSSHSTQQLVNEATQEAQAVVLPSSAVARVQPGRVQGQR
jgi:hypothetical protein